MMAERPTTIRNISNPRPGAPPGNVENNGSRQNSLFLQPRGCPRNTNPPIGFLYDYFSGLHKGMRISRRPKSRASTECAPGPNRKMPIAIAAANKTDSFESNNDASPAELSTTKVVAIGVNKPIVSKPPTTSAINPSHTGATLESSSQSVP